LDTPRPSLLACFGIKQTGKAHHGSKTAVPQQKDQTPDD